MTDVIDCCLSGSFPELTQGPQGQEPSCSSVSQQVDGFIAQTLLSTQQSRDSLWLDLGRCH